MAKTPYWLTRAFSLVERDDLTVNLDQLTTLQKVGSAPAPFNCDSCSMLEQLQTTASYFWCTASFACRGVSWGTF